MSSSVAKAQTSKRGTFTLKGVEKVGRVAVSAPNYEPVDKKAAESLGTIKLKPVPVSGTVVGNLYKKGIVAQVSAGGSTYDSKDDGSFTVYNVGPGDTLTVTAEGYIDGEGQVDDQRQATILLEPTPKSVKARDDALRAEAERIRAEEKAQDLPLIKALWREASDVWTVNDQAGYFAALDWDDAHSYPGSVGPPGALRESCSRNLDGVTDWNLDREYVLDEASVERDDGWRIFDSPLEGQIPSGRTYIMKVENTQTLGGPFAPRTTTSESHVTILDGKAYWYPPPCSS